MRVGSKGRYAVTAVIFLAKQDKKMPMPLAEIAKLHEIPCHTLNSYLLS